MRVVCTLSVQVYNIAIQWQAEEIYNEDVNDSMPGSEMVESW